MTNSHFIELKYLKFRPRPKKDGLRDSGYRYIELVGVAEDGTEYDCGGWHDHLVMEADVNIDVEPDGTIRIMPWLGNRLFRIRAGEQFWVSTAWLRKDGLLE